MYLSRIWLDERNRNTMRALATCNRFHGAVESADPDRGRKLWRVDGLGGKKCLLVLSSGQLDFTDVSRQFGDGRYEQACYDGLLDKIKDGTMWAFRLVANPSVCRTDETRGYGRYGHVTAWHQLNWLSARAERNGFALDPGKFDVVGRRNVEFKKSTGERVRFVSCCYEGMLEVTDESRFRDMLVSGIGREKAYGQGLMTVFPAW